MLQLIQNFGGEHPWNVLCIGTDLGARIAACAGLAELRHRGRGVALHGVEAMPAAGRPEGPEMAVICVAAAQAADCAAWLRDRCHDWETALLVFDDGAADGAALEELQHYQIAAVADAGGSRLAQGLLLALQKQEAARAIRLISQGAGSLLSARNLRQFAERALALVGCIPGVPEHCLFCLHDAGSGHNFVVAGSGRFAAVKSCPVEELADEAVRHVILRESCDGDAEELWAIQLPEAQSILIYLADPGGARLRINRQLQRVIRNQVIATFDHLTTLERIRRAHRATVIALADLAEFKDTETGEHVLRVARTTDEITAVLRAKELFAEHLDDAFVDQVGAASILHDIGKVAIPDSILLKPGKLDADERKAMEQHTLQGAAILDKAGRLAQETLYLSLATEVAAAHHEQYDGSGYPRGLRGEEIPLAARIVAVVDVFDALTSKRPYKEPWPQEQAVAFIRERAGSQFDPQVVDAFLEVIERRQLVGLIEWQDKLSVGHAQLDADHARLISLINQLATAQLIGNRNIVEYTLDELLFYIRDHFQREEAHMETIGHERLEPHRRAHRHFAGKVEQARWQYQRGLRDDLGQEMLRFLTDWLFSHILEEDMRYRPAQ